MGLEKQPTGRFDAHCDACGKTLELDSYGPAAAGYKLLGFGWKRVGYPSNARRPAYVWHCAACCDKELAL